MRAIQGRWLLATATALTLTACGGVGGTTNIASTPVPPPSPPPAPPPPPDPIPIKIFPTPTIGQYASVGASISGPGGNLDTYSSATERFGTISTDPADQAHIRYTAGGFYEVQLAGANWDRLVPYELMVDPHPDNNYFQPASVQANYGYVLTSNSRNNGYTYSEIASWGSSAQHRRGYFAFGVATPVGGVPTSGSATFQGAAYGSTDIMIADNLYGGYYPLPTDGTVTLNFDFGAGSLAGRMDLFLPDGMNPIPLTSFAFQQTVFSAGSTTYSGTFGTSATGQNFFLGQLTGPNAEETIGAWAVPFVFDHNGSTIAGDGQTHHAFGAWIAKPGP